MSTTGGTVQAKVDAATRAQVLAALRGAPKEFNAQLRIAAKSIAAHRMVPAYAQVMHTAGRAYGPALAADVRPRSDRLPAVAIGTRRRVYSGGASTIMVRYSSGAGRALGYARSRYESAAMRDWLAAVETTCARWNAGA